MAAKEGHSIEDCESFYILKRPIPTRAAAPPGSTSRSQEQSTPKSSSYGHKPKARKDFSKKKIYYEESDSDVPPDREEYFHPSRQPGPPSPQYETPFYPGSTNASRPRRPTDFPATYAYVPGPDPAYPNLGRAPPTETYYSHEYNANIFTVEPPTASAHKIYRNTANTNVPFSPGPGTLNDLPRDSVPLPSSIRRHTSDSYGNQSESNTRPIPERQGISSSRSSREKPPRASSRAPTRKPEVPMPPPPKLYGVENPKYTSQPEISSSGSKTQTPPSGRTPVQKPSRAKSHRPPDSSEKYKLSDISNFQPSPSTLPRGRPRGLSSTRAPTHRGTSRTASRGPRREESSYDTDYDTRPQPPAANATEERTKRQASRNPTDDAERRNQERGRQRERGRSPRGSDRPPAPSRSQTYGGYPDPSSSASVRPHPEDAHLERMRQGIYETGIRDNNANQTRSHIVSVIEKRDGNKVETIYYL